MHHQLLLTPKPNASYTPLSLLPTNPNPSNPQKTRVNSNSLTNSCRGIEVSVLNKSSNNPVSSNNSSNSSGIFNGSFSNDNDKDIDISTLGNLCVDIVLNVPLLPPKDKFQRKAYMDHLASSPPDKKFWEAGGLSNAAIAAARLGLRCVAMGHIGNDIYGHFLLDVFRDEGIDFVKMSDTPEAISNGNSAYDTLLCWVLVDPLQKHGFCSQADFAEAPAFSWMLDLTRDVKLAIKKSKILVVNGYGFDDLSPGLMVSALKYAVDVGTCVFFDPGPRGRSLSAGSPEEQMALSEYLKMSDVLLLTSDEAESLTGIRDPLLAGQELLKRGIRTQWVIIKMGSKGSILVTLSGTSCAPAFKAKVIDTVGCGDSFVAAVAFGFVHKMPMIHTLAISNAVGAATAMGCGAGRNVATFAKTMELIQAGDLNEEEQFWSELLVGRAETKEVTLLSKKVIGKLDNGLNCVALAMVTPELTSKLESRSCKAMGSANSTR